MTPAAALVVSEGQRDALEVSRSQTASHRQVQRARALLLAADGVANTRIAEQVGVWPATVRSWRARFAAEGLAKLGKVRAGRGRKSSIPQDKIDEIVHLTLHSTPEGQTHWSCRTMAERGRGVVGDGAADVGRARAETASGRRRSSCPTTPVRGEVDRRGRPVPESAGEGDRAVHGREVLGAGAGPHPTVAADEEGPGGDDDPRLQAQRHHHAVRGAGRADRQGDRRSACPGTATRSS